MRNLIASINAANDLKAAWKAGKLAGWPYAADEFDRLAGIIKPVDPHFAGDLEEVARKIREAA